MLPVIALVGRPNVGKSTLFNRLTKTREALVANFSGLTRDRQYGRVKHGEREFIAVDTCGIVGDEEGLEAEAARQSHLAIEEADIVLLLVDLRDGPNPSERELVQKLRKAEKLCFLIANKMDGIDAESAVTEFYSYGIADTIAISASQGRGINQMLDRNMQLANQGLQARSQASQLQGQAGQLQGQIGMSNAANQTQASLSNFLC